MSATPKPALPLYREIANQLAADIVAGKYPLNAVLPGEIELAASFSMSRHTAREAMKILEQDGLITRKRRVGSVVVARRPLQKYHQRVQTADDLLQYRQASRLRITHVAHAQLQGQAAQQLAVPEGSAGIQLKGLRFQPGSDRPFAYSEIYLLAVRGSSRLPTLARAFAFLLKRLDAGNLKGVEQTMSAENATAELAEALQIEPGLATFKTVRTYIDNTDTPIVTALNWHPGDSFLYSTRLTRS
jgi:GntR family transcriptional regulator